MANLVHPAAIASVASFIKNKNDLFNWYRWYIEIAVFIYINLCVTICPMLYVFDFLAVNYMYMTVCIIELNIQSVITFLIFSSEYPSQPQEVVYAGKPLAKSSSSITSQIP